MIKEDYICKVVYLQCRLAELVYQKILQYSIGENCSCISEKIEKLHSALTILNSYDTRDLPDFSTDYNHLTKDQILCTLNYAETL